MTLIAGVRYERDRQQRHGSAGRLSLDFDGTFEAWLPKFTAVYELSAGNSVGVLAQRAFNPGGVTIDFFTAEADTFDAETLWDFEAFGRFALLGGAMHVEANLFYNRIRDAQRLLVREIVLPDGTRDFASEFANAPRARSYGAELQLDWRVVPTLRFAAGLGVLRTKILETNEPEDPLLGKEFAHAPHFTAFAAIDWRPTETLRLSAQLRRNSAYFSEDSNDPELRIGATTLVDARVGWSPTLPVTLFGYARNLFDNFYMTDLFAPNFGTVGDAREVGIGLHVTF
jgi:outer membrane receptor protein involved in Fe transport